MKRTPALAALPRPVLDALQLLGRDISVARKRRKLPQRLLAEKMLVNVETVRRLEQGDPGVSIGVVASALFVLGMVRRLGDLAQGDQIGESEALRALPKRVRQPSDSELDF